MNGDGYHQLREFIIGYVKSKTIVLAVKKEKAQKPDSPRDATNVSLLTTADIKQRP